MFTAPSGHIEVASEADGGGFGGGTFVSEADTLTLTYTYETVPEVGSSFSLLAIGLAAVALSRRNTIFNIAA